MFFDIFIKGLQDVDLKLPSLVTQIQNHPHRRVWSRQDLYFLEIHQKLRTS